MFMLYIKNITISYGRTTKKSGTAIRHDKGGQG